jgi:hypothetical protein
MLQPFNVLFFYLKYRIISFSLAVLLFIGSFYYAASSRIEINDAKEIAADLYNKKSNIDQKAIFLNNIVPALSMFIPGFGILYGTNAAYSTGFSFAALASLNPALSSIHPLSLFVTSYGIIELVAYGIAMSRSGLLIYLLLKKRRFWKDYTILTAIEIGIVTALILAGSILEWNFLKNRGN